MEIPLRLKLLIADDEPLICSMLEKIIKTDELGIEIIGFAYDGDTLMSLIEKEQPDIVITDICMPGKEGLDVIGISTQRGYSCRFVVISGFRQFDYAYNALKYNVSDYLLKPIDEAEINEVIQKIAEEIRSDGISYKSSTNILRNFFMKKAIYELEPHQLSLNAVNSTYGTSFQPGVFRCVAVKIDYSEEPAQMNDSLSSFQDKIEELARTSFLPRCFETLTDRGLDRVDILVNYPGAQEEIILKNIQELLQQVQNITDRFYGMYVNVGVGTGYGELKFVKDSKKEAESTIWARMMYGSGKVFFYEEVSNMPKSPYSDRLQNLLQDIQRALAMLDVKDFHERTEEFFALPNHALGRVEVYEQMNGLIDGFFEHNAEYISSFSDIDNMINDFVYTLGMAHTMERYARIFQGNLSAVMEHILAYSSTKNARPVRQAASYVEEHFGEHISLDMVAKEVGLSKVYFSNIFKNEMGQGFSEFLTEIRIRKAKEFLKHSNKNILEIAEEVGFNDAKYFSKIFKKAIGITPTEYRKIYG